MISKRTVFILGAGASQPFGFPTGRQLYDRMLTNLRPGQYLFDNLQRFGGFSEADIYKFRDTLGKSARTSVDAFLEHRPEFMGIGKLSIAAALIVYENEDTLFGDAGEWMGYLFNHFDHPFELRGGQPGNRNLGFITFNYDRSLEHFLFTAYKNSYGKTDEETAAAVQLIPILHLHGTLGRLPWQQGQGAVRPFTSVIDSDSLKIAKEGIKIVHESLDDGRDKEFERAKGMLKGAQRIYCLGFGYGNTNMRRLGLDQLEQAATGTGRGLTDAEGIHIRNMTKSKVVPQVGYDCMDFLRNSVLWGV